MVQPALTLGGRTSEPGPGSARAILPQQRAAEWETDARAPSVMFHTNSHQSRGSPWPSSTPQVNICVSAPDCGWDCSACDRAMRLLLMMMAVLLGWIPWSVSVASSADVAAGLVNERVRRTVDLTTQLAVHRLSIAVRNTARGGLGTYTLALPTHLADGLASVKAVTAPVDDDTAMDDAALFAAAHLLPVREGPAPDSTPICSDRWPARALNDAEGACRRARYTPPPLPHHSTSRSSTWSFLTSYAPVRVHHTRGLVTPACPPRLTPGGCSEQRACRPPQLEARGAVCSSAEAPPHAPSLCISRR